MARRKQRGPTVAEYDELWGPGKARVDAERRKVVAARRSRRHARKEQRDMDNWMESQERRDYFSGVRRRRKTKLNGINPDLAWTLVFGAAALGLGIYLWKANTPKLNGLGANCGCGA